jgi:hypothetical protein
MPQHTSDSKEGFGIASIVVCFFDLEQRPSRNAVIELNRRRAELEAKRIVIVAVHTTSVEPAVLEAWAEENHVRFPIGTMENGEVMRQTWGVRSLPWLVLTDRTHVVQSKGMSLSELDAVTVGAR